MLGASVCRDRAVDVRSTKYGVVQNQLECDLVAEVCSRAVA